LIQKKNKAERINNIKYYLNSNEYQFITLDAVPGGKDSSHRLLPEHNPNILPRRKKRDEIWP